MTTLLYSQNQTPYWDVLVNNLAKKEENVKEEKVEKIE